MSDLPKNQPIKIRTFAADLDAVRNLREQAKVTETPVPTPVIPEPEPEPAEKLGEIRIKNVKNTTPTIKAKPSKKIPEVAIVEPTAIKNTGLSGVTKIPSFHELQKQIHTIQNDVPNKTESPKAITKFKKLEHNNQESHRQNIGYDATIITDTKTDDFNLFSSIITSVKGWFNKIQAERKKRKMPLYSVPSTDRRKGVIQRATTKTATTIATDNRSIKEQIKRRKQIETEVKKHTPETTWSPFTDSVFSLLEAPDQTENVVVEYKKISQPTPASTPEQIIENTTTEIGSIKEILPEEVIEVTEEPTISTEDEQVDDVFSEERWASSYEDEQIAPEINRKVFATLNTPVLNNNIDSDLNESPGRTSLFSKIDPNTSIVLLLIIIASLIVIIIVGRIIINSKLNNIEEVSTAQTFDINPILTEATPVFAVLTTDTVKDYPSLIKSTIKTAPAGIIELITVSPTGSEMSGAYTFDLLNFRTIPNLRHSLTAARFISINHGAPALLLQFVDPDTVTGALLQWETTIIIDTHSLYQTSYEIKPIFTDSVVNGINIRILSHDSKVVLVYGLINDNTALVTNNIDDFDQISKLEMSK